MSLIIKIIVKEITKFVYIKIPDSAGTEQRSIQCPIFQKKEPDIKCPAHIHIQYLFSTLERSFIHKADRIHHTHLHLHPQNIGIILRFAPL